MKSLVHNYHDATFEAAVINWESGEVILHFQLCAASATRITISVKGVSEFICPRKFPWGKSVSVNRMSIVDVSDEVRLNIQMQSGDEIVLVGKQVSEEPE